MALVLVVTGAAFSPTEVRAAIACQQAGFQNFFDGIVTNSPQYGAKASITDRALALCSNVNGATSGGSAWVMLSGGGPSQYAQIGYAKIAGMASTLTFTEYNDGEGQEPNWHRAFYNGIFSAGATHSYTVSYNFSTGRVGMSVDGSSKATTPFSPDNEWTPGWRGQFNGETLDSGDDVPGTAAAHTRIAGVLTKACRGCAYANPAGIPIEGGDLPAYKFAWILGTGEVTFDIWTQR